MPCDCLFDMIYDTIFEMTLFDMTPIEMTVISKSRFETIVSDR